jgi:hypothetical protein
MSVHAAHAVDRDFLDQQFPFDQHRLAPLIASGSFCRRTLAVAWLVDLRAAAVAVIHPLSFWSDGRGQMLLPPLNERRYRRS